jgi:hypothetical protein
MSAWLKRDADGGAEAATRKQRQRNSQFGTLERRRLARPSYASKKSIQAGGHARAQTQGPCRAKSGEPKVKSVKPKRASTNSPTKEPTGLIDAFRRQHGLDMLGDPVWSREQNSVSTCQVDGVPYVGVNSRALTYSDRDNASAEQVRDSLIQNSPRLMNTNNTGGFPNNAVFHAEATCLLRAARANGGTLAGKTIEVTVDRKMCWSCERILPAIGLELGNPEVVFVDAKGRVRLMRDGVWIKRR